VLYPSETWPDEHWEDPNGAVPSGWAVDTTGNAPDTAVSYVAVGSGYAMQLDSDADGKAMISKTFTALTTATTWEMRAEIKAADLGTTAVSIPLTVRDGTKNLSLRPSSSGLRIYNGSSTAAAILATSMSAGDWITYTIRREGDVVYLYDGPFLVHMALYSSFPSDTALAGQVRLGNSDTAAKTATIRRFSLYTGGVNTTPPSYTMRGTTHGR
jgi:hypothetical protein